MDATEQNVRICRSILSLFAAEGCTVDQAESILYFLRQSIRDTAMVQCPDNYLADLEATIQADLANEK